jgi:hypothetical protein
MVVGARALAFITLVAIVLVQFADYVFATPPCSACGIPPHGAPGPIVGAGLPILAIGFGAYWLAGRLRRKPD